MNTLQKFEAKQLADRQENTNIPDFAPGDTVKVNVKVREGTRERVQAFEGVCIARKSDGINSSFTVRKISLGEGVERVFALYSPRLDSIELVRRGSVRRAKLYYLRDRRGKSARIAERTAGHGIEAKVAHTETKTARINKKKADKAAAKVEAKAAAAKAAEERAAAKQAEAEAAAAEADTPETNSED